MPNHIHLIWHIQDGYKREKIQLRFMKYTAQQIKFRLIDTQDLTLQNYLVMQQIDSISFGSETH